MFKIKLKEKTLFFVKRIEPPEISDCFRLSTRQVGKISKDKEKLFYSYGGIKK